MNIFHSYVSLPEGTAPQSTSIQAPETHPRDFRTHSLDQIQPFCTRGRASALGCYVQTVSWSNGARDKKAYRAMNAAWLENVTGDAMIDGHFMELMGNKK
jgi:hypothetical protein